jgi:hypothetical protein
MAVDFCSGSALAEPKSMAASACAAVVPSIQGTIKPFKQQNIQVHIIKVNSKIPILSLDMTAVF